MIQNGGAFFDCGESKYAFQNFNFAVSIRERILLTPKFPVSVEDSMQMHPMRTALCRSGYLNTDALHLISPLSTRKLGRKLTGQNRRCNPTA